MENRDDRHSPTCRSFIAKLGRTPDRTKRLAILAACAKVRAPWSEELLWEALGDTCEGVRDAVLKELLERDPLCVKQALERLDRPPWYAKSAALKIIGQKRIREALPELRRVIRDPNADVRRSAAEALGEIGGREALGLLVGLKKDPNQFVRAAAEGAILKASPVRFS
ncbi:MAG: HEAT repeat domain-containing protein [Candidatus Aminicenantes bacterium]|nr:HEAT repeat domain-containing protein [Candidatus Aminicenantes bacterium]